MWHAKTNEDTSDTVHQQFEGCSSQIFATTTFTSDKHNFLGRNQKLATKLLGTHKILHLKCNANVEILLKHNNKKTVVHANCLKPYFVTFKYLATCLDLLKSQ